MPSPWLVHSIWHVNWCAHIGRRHRSAGMRAGREGETRSRRIREEIRAKLFDVWRDGLVFWSAAHVVVFAMPIWWLQPIVEHQPVSYTIEAMRGLALEGPVAEPVLFSVLWSAGIFAVCAVPLAIGFRRASKRG